MIALYQQRNFGEKINATFQYLVLQFRSLGMCLLYIAGPVVLVAGIGSGLSESAVRGNVFGLLSRASIISTVGYLLAFWLVPLVTYSHLKVYHETWGEPVAVRAVWREVRGSFGRAMVGIFLSSLLYLIGSVIFIIPGIYFSVTLSLILSVVVIEEAGASDAISRCMTLVRDNWWSTCGLLVSMGFIYLSLLSLIFVPMILWDLLRAVLNLPTMPPLVMAFLSAFLVLALLLFAVVVMLALGFQYGNLVEKHEHVGLTARIDAIGYETPQSDHRTAQPADDDDFYA
jgi:hypothetical protein